jgi:osmotically-inducible protein OsmY
MFRRVIGAVLAVTLLAGSAAAQTPRKDFQILNDISNRVNGYAQFTIFDDVSASIERGVVTLTGKVTMPFKRDDIGAIAGRVAGVTEVMNKIDVLPVSIYDDELRYRIARAIYTNPAFWNYAAMARPPIHIVVERGRVTLTGVVNSNVDRMLARSLASSFGAFSVTSELKTDAEVKAAETAFP